MESASKSSTSLFEVYLRLRPSSVPHGERFLDVEGSEGAPTHITMKPPSTDHRKRAVEKFAFTRVFEEDASQIDIFEGTGVLPLLEGVLGTQGRDGRDGVLATLGVTGSGKSHTILGSKSQRGLIQLTLDVLYRSVAGRLPVSTPTIVCPSLAAADVSEANLLSAPAFLDTIYGDGQSERGYNSRAQTPCQETSQYWSMPRKHIPRPSMLPQVPSVDNISLPIDRDADYAIVISMYEVYNDRIFDLLTMSATTAKTNAYKRRALLFKPTERSPDRKVVAGLRKIICNTMEEALLVLETGLMERRVAGTGSNAVSSRSHGFFCVEVKKRRRASNGPWKSSTLTIVDLAGSERARNAKTAGATLAEAGKINESLMYLGQCMQMQSDNQDGHKNLVPFRQCKLTELLFSNAFSSPMPTYHQYQQSAHHSTPRSSQKAVMIVTADASGDFNATSQILRYSALAREVTVPRIPSTSSQILAGTITVSSSRQAASGSNSPVISSEELEHATDEINRLSEQVEILHLQLRDERSRRWAAESSWKVAEERMEALEREIREECYEQMETALEAERRRWKGAWVEEADHGDERMDKKIEILARGIHIHEDAEPSASERLTQLEEENERLRATIENMEREKENQKSPTKKQRILKAKKWEADFDFEGLSYS